MDEGTFHRIGKRSGFESEKSNLILLLQFAVNYAHTSSSYELEGAVNQTLVAMGNKCCVRISTRESLNQVGISKDWTVPEQPWPQKCERHEDHRGKLDVDFKELFCKFPVDCQYL